MDPSKPAFSLRQMELETLEEAREWGRRRLQDKLEKLIEEQGAISPPQRLAFDPSATAPVEAAKHQRRNHS